MEDKFHSISPFKMDDKWWIHVTSDRIGSCFLLQPGNMLPIPQMFDTEEQAEQYIIEYKQKHNITYL